MEKMSMTWQRSSSLSWRWNGWMEGNGHPSLTPLLAYASSGLTISKTAMKYTKDLHLTNVFSTIWLLLC